MIEYIQGEIVELTPTYVVLDNSGIGYFLNISLNCYTALQEKRDVKLYVFESIREDAHTLYGFFNKQEREMFILLISVSGVGASTARMILSSLKTDELQQTIASGNSNLLKSVKGIGAKTAQRIIVDLKDKINIGTDSLTITDTSSSESYDEALAALMMLGFTQQMSQKALKKLFAENVNLSVEEAIKKALKMM